METALSLSGILLFLDLSPSLLTLWVTSSILRPLKIIAYTYRSQSSNLVLTFSLMPRSWWLLGLSYLAVYCACQSQHTSNWTPDFPLRICSALSLNLADFSYSMKSSSILSCQKTWSHPWLISLAPYPIHQQSFAVWFSGYSTKLYHLHYYSSDPSHHTLTQGAAMTSLSLLASTFMPQQSPP